MKNLNKNSITYSLLKSTLPLMLTLISTTAMMFADRLILARYSIDALGAAVNAGTIAWGFNYGFQLFTEMSQVLVAKYKGAKKDTMLSDPPWQMIWLCLVSFIIFIPLALLGGHLFFTANSDQETYFKTLIFYGPFFGLIGSCSAYFIGLGRGKMVLYSAIIGNVVNIALDFMLIFGLQPYLNPMGIKGAAVATGLGIVVQAAYLFTAFIRETGFKIVQFKFKEFKSCCHVGFPPALFITTELIGWGLFFSMMTIASSTHIKVTSICHSLMPVFACLAIGLQKAIGAKTGFSIGAKDIDSISKWYQSAVKILSIYMVFLFLVVFFFKNLIATLFLGSPSKYAEFHMLSNLIHTGLMLSCGYLFFGGLRNIYIGILSAAKDSRFLSFFGAASIWVFLLLPTYYFVVTLKASVTVAQLILMLYGVMVCLIYSYRFMSKGWKKPLLLEEIDA